MGGGGRVQVASAAPQCPTMRGTAADYGPERLAMIQLDDLPVSIL